MNEGKVEEMTEVKTSNRRPRDYIRKVFTDEEKNVRYDLKVMDYGLTEKFVLKKYEKRTDGKWKACGSRIIVEANRDEELMEMWGFMSQHIMDVRQELNERNKD